MISSSQLTRTDKVSLDGKTWREAHHLKGIEWL